MGTHPIFESDFDCLTGLVAVTRVKMAKWGEGDPRWIVEQRADAHNINNWHWKEVDANKWSEDRLKLLFGEIKSVDGPFEFTITKLNSIKGESMASNRKNKLICYWDYDVDLTSTKIDKDETHDNDVLKFAKPKGHRAIRAAMKQYSDELRSEFAAKVCQVPSNEDGGAATSAPTPTTTTPNKESVAKLTTEINKVVVEKKDETGSKIKTKKLILKETFMCSCEDFYNVLVDRQRVEAWSRGAQVYNAEKNGKFLLFSGNVSGTFTELVESKKIVKSWRLKHWPEGHHSVATIELSQTDKGTRMTLTQSGVPETDVERTKQGWKNFYWNPIKFTFGFGVEVS